MNPSSSLRQGRMAQRPSRASMEGVSPLMYSCQQGHVQQVRQLLQRKVCFLLFFLPFFLSSFLYLPLRICLHSMTIPLLLRSLLHRRTSLLMPSHQSIKLFLLFRPELDGVLYCPSYSSGPIDLCVFVFVWVLPAII